MTDNRAELNGPVLLKKTYQNPDAEAEVLTVIGTAYKGPAFVPKQVVQHEADANIRNTFVNIFGETEDNRFRHLRDQFNSRIDSQGYIASENWFANGGEQLSYVRVLGIGNGVKNENGLYTNSGFNVSDVIPRGSVFSNGEYRNPYAVEGGAPGSLSFLIKKFKSKVVPSETLDGFNDYLSELDVSASLTDYGFITDVILCPSGVLPTLHDEDATNQILATFQFEIDRTNEDKINNALEEKIATLDFTNNSGLFGNYRSSINIIGSENTFIYLNGLDNSDDTSTYNTLLISKDNDFLNLSNTLYNENQSKNYYNNRILNKGHVFYATFQNNNSLTYKLNDKEEKNIKIITTRNDLNLGQYPDFNDFNDRYRTAKTPWIVSQPINRIGLSDNREELSDKVDKLFKIHALDDGEIGNRYRIKIHPQQIFYKEEMKYSIFSIYVYEYDCFNNSYSLLETYKDLDLNPDSKDFIGRRIGTQYKYYDIETKRVYMKGFYPLVSENIRIELHEDVVNHKIEKVSIPSGFEAYPHINFQKESFYHYGNINSDFYNSLDNVKQLPITYMPSYVRDDSSIETREIFENHWGPLFFPINNGEDLRTNIILKQNGNNTTDTKSFLIKYYSKTTDTESNVFFSPHYFYTKYFQSSHINTNKNVLIEESDWSNSLFHLERIAYPIIKDQNTDKFNNNFTRSIYRRSGKALDSSYMPVNLENYYQYLNLDEVLNDDINKNNRVQDSKKLSFDLFTYGGFDGVNILDSDKRQLNNDAIVRERLIENKRVTTVAYERCVELVSGYENCLGDVLIIPGIREEDVIRKSLKEIKEENRLIYCSEIIGLTTNESIVGSFYNIKNESRANRLDALEFDSDFVYRDLIKSKFSTFSLFDKIDYNDKNFMPLLGEVLDGNRRIKLCPSIYVSGLFAQTVADNVNDIDNQYQFGSELIDNENLKASDDNFLINENRLKKNCLNIMYENTPFESSSLNLLTANTTFGIRSSAYRKVSTVRVMNHIKKRLEFLLIIGPNSILFDSFAKTNGIYQKTKNLINGLMTELRDDGIIKNFSVSIPDGGDAVNPDVFENLLRGKIYIQLNNLDTKDANLNTISLGELTKEIKSLTNTLDSFKILSIN